MPDIEATIDGILFANGQSSWAAARDASTAPGGVNTTTLRSSNAVKVQRSAGRGGSTIYGIQRVILEFDTSAISSNPDSATLKIYGFANGTADLYVVRANLATANAIVAGDFEPQGWTSGVDNSSNVYKLSSEVTTWSTSGYNEIALNGDARTFMRTDNDFAVMLIEADYDLPNNAPASTLTVQSGMYFDTGGASFKPVLSYTLPSTAAYPNNVNGVATADIGKINGIATADIEKVNGVA